MRHRQDLDAIRIPKGKLRRGAVFDVRSWREGVLAEGDGDEEVDDVVDSLEGRGGVEVDVGEANVLGVGGEEGPCEGVV